MSLLGLFLLYIYNFLIYFYFIRTKDESKPSYALATVASSARVTRRLYNQNAI